MKKISKKEKYFLIVLVVILIAVNYSFLNNFLVENFSGKEVVFVERVVDGDTVIVNGSSVRLLGINTPERGEKYYSEAKEFLESEVLGRALIIERHGQDKYYRDLAYLFDFESGENINLEIVREGYGNYYFPSGKNGYCKEFFSAWNECIFYEKNLCEKSGYFDCLILEEWNFGEDKIVLKNVCDRIGMSGWSLKDEGRKKFIFQDFVLVSGEKIEITAEDFGEEYVWTSTGDSFFLRDAENKLVLFGRGSY